MAIVAGVDEAGFGPMLGPLVMSATAFRVSDEHADRCFWHALRATCCRHPSKSGRRLAVADSKALYRGGDGMDCLERAALVMLGICGQRPESWHSLLELVAPHALPPAKSCSWYQADVALPIDDGVGDLGTRINAVRRNCAEAGLDFLGAFSEPLAEHDYNQMVARTHNKATVNTGLCLRAVGRVLASATDAEVRIYVDRLGGRVHYREALGDSFPAYSMEVLEESGPRSAYRLCGGGRRITIEFAVGGEERHFATALASVFSKYIRELYMTAFNRYWAGQIAGIRPTAGYHGDAARWLKEAEPALQRMSVSRSVLVRER